ncbi:MAG: twin transmembrane helix small protein [Alphaproteobacteria bacterium]
MSGVFVVFMVLAMVATLAVLVLGIIGMARGGDFNRRYANKFMRARVLLQASALLLFAIVLFFVGRG